MYLKYLILVSCFLFYACKEKEQNVITHPTKENILEAKDIEILLSKKNISSPSSEIKNWVDFFKSKTNITNIGSNTKKEDILGYIQGVDSDGNNIYILDSRDNNIKIYNHQGNKIQKYGQKGEGPNEFLYPQSLYLVDNKLFVSDRRGIIKVIDKNKMELEKIINIKDTPEDFCVINKGIYVAAPSVEQNILVQKKTMEGKQDGGFGELYKSNNSMARFSLSSSTLSCNEKGGEILIGNGRFGTIVSYKEMNNKWVKNIDIVVEDFKVGTIIQSKDVDGATMMEYSYKGSLSVLYGIKHLNKYNYLIQIALFKDRKIENIETYIINTDKRESYFIGNKFPIITKITPNNIIAYKQLPYPQVVIFS
ncbi:MAG: 6-bladed beta-propeller [Rhodothermia bacterium]|nr:6-bladed beta-propeller [Rhodothermia bacterium]